jgi:hypothetical protein
MVPLGKRDLLSEVGFEEPQELMRSSGLQGLRDRVCE